MESSISPHKYIGYDPALHAYSQQCYTGYDVFPPTFSTWEGYAPQGYFNRYMGNAPVQNYFHETAYPSENSHGQRQQTDYDSHLSQQQGSNISVVDTQCKDEDKATTPTNKEPHDIYENNKSPKCFEGITSEQSTDAYSDKAGYAMSDYEADTESLAGEGDHLLTCTLTLLLKQNASSLNLLQDSIDGNVAYNETISSTETVPETKKEKI